MRKNLGAMGMPDLHIHVQVKTPGGVILEDRWEKGHSWTRNAWNAYNAAMIDAGGNGAISPGPGKFTGINTAGTIYSNTGVFGFERYGTLSGAGFHNNGTSYTAFGIVVGTNAGDEEFHIDAFCLNSQIGHGTGAGQLTHSAQSAPVVSYNSETKKWNTLITRVFNNNSGGTINVKELGLISTCGIFGGQTTFLMAHDILDTPVELLNTAQLTVTYSLTTQAMTSDTDWPVPAWGTAGSGGYVAGPSYHPALNVADYRYILIAAPVSGGQSGSALQWRTANTPLSGVTDERRGQNNMAAILGLGADSPIGAFCAAANAADLGGFDDWYIPARDELRFMIYGLKANMPSGQEWSAAQYWSSTGADSYYPYFVNMSDNSTSQDTMTTTRLVRLVRRIRTDDFVAA